MQAGLDRDQARGVLEDPDAYLDAVRHDESEAARLGAGGVPYFVVDRGYALSGAQSTASFAEALQTAWDEQLPSVLGGDAAVCGPDGICAVPSTP